MVCKWGTGPRAFVRPAYWHCLILGTIFTFSESLEDWDGDRWSGSPITLRVWASWFGVIHCGVAGLVLKLSPATHAHSTRLTGHQYPGRGEVALPVFRLKAEIVDSQGLGLFCS